MRYIPQKNGPGLLLPNNDFVFKLLFGSPKRKPYLVSFLKAILNLPPDDYDVTIINPYLQNDGPGAKLAVVDVRLATPSGKVINIEMQVARKAGFEERLVFGLSKLVTEQLNEGEDYRRIHKAIAIAITDFDLCRDELAHHRFVLYDKIADLSFGDVEELDLLELRKVDKLPEGGLKAWAKFLGAKSEADLQEAAAMSNEVKQAVQDLYIMSEESKLRQEYDRRVMYQMDIRAEKAYEREEGIKQGLTQGLKQGLTQGLTQGRNEILALLDPKMAAQIRQKLAVK
jgi:predicted transposase/invertase (TIGR01784 family)